MNHIAHFEKVSFEQFSQDMLSFGFSDSLLQLIYRQIKLPVRATAGSAGYDFFAPFDLRFRVNQTTLLPTGIRAYIEPGWVLQIYPRSSYGFKYQLQLDNTVGIIDSDYYKADNQGHIMIKMTNGNINPLDIKTGNAFAQGLFIPYGICTDDNTSAQRHGGVGSTGQ